MVRSPIDIAIAALRASDRPLTLKELSAKAKVAEGDASAALGRLMNFGLLDMECPAATSGFYVAGGMSKDEVVVLYSYKEAA